MDGRKKIIVYGIGKAYQNIRVYLENKFQIIGYSDSNKEIRHKIKGVYIEPEKIYKYDFDYIYITSTKYYDEINKKLLDILGDGYIDKIISIYDILGDFRNEAVRDNWVIEHLRKIPDGKIILDAGAGEQKYKPYCTHLKYIAQDFGKYDPNDVKAGFQLKSWDYSGTNIICDIVDMPLENESIDVILCTEVFEHLKNPVLAIKEFSRVLKSGGQLILTAPSYNVKPQITIFRDFFDRLPQKIRVNGDGYRCIKC